MIDEVASVLGHRLGYLPNAHPIFAGGAQHGGFLFGPLHSTETRDRHARNVAALLHAMEGCNSRATRCCAAGASAAPCKALSPGNRDRQNAALDAAIVNFPDERFTLRNGIQVIREHPLKPRSG
jgi:hypothetical protein